MHILLIKYWCIKPIFRIFASIRISFGFYISHIQFFSSATISIKSMSNFRTRKRHVKTTAIYFSIIRSSSYPYFISYRDSPHPILTFLTGMNKFMSKDGLFSFISMTIVIFEQDYILTEISRTSVVFRYCPAGSGVSHSAKKGVLTRLNIAIIRRLMELRTVRRMFRIYVNAIFRQFGAFSQLFIGKNPSDSRTRAPSINVIQFNSRVLVSPVFKFEIYIIKPFPVAENVYPEHKPFSKFKFAIW